MSALKFIRKYFPEVEEVVDSAKSVRVRVTQRDISGGRKKDPIDCALARACVREDKADGAIVGVGFSYLIKGRKAMRFKTSNTVAREIVAFDRSKSFEPGGEYLLSKVSPSRRLGRQRKPHSGSRGPRRHIVHHRTSNIRVLKY